MRKILILMLGAVGIFLILCGFGFGWLTSIWLSQPHFISDGEYPVLLEMHPKGMDVILYSIAVALLIAGVGTGWLSFKLLKRVRPPGRQ